MSLKGGAELRARLKVMRTFFKPAGKEWATEVRSRVRQENPSQRVRQSARVRNASTRKATVVASYIAFFIDAGVKRHEIKPKRAKTLRFESGGNIVFAKRVNHPGYRARPFRQRIAEDALRRHPLLNTLIEEWNKAGGRARLSS